MRLSHRRSVIPQPVRLLNGLRNLLLLSAQTPSAYQPQPFPSPVLKSCSMHPSTGQLQELQRLDQMIASLQSDLAGLPKRMKDADAQLTGARTAVANAKAVHAQALSEKKKSELDVEQWKTRAKKYRE